MPEASVPPGRVVPGTEGQAPRFLATPQDVSLADRSQKQSDEEEGRNSINREKQCQENSTESKNCYSLKTNTIHKALLGLIRGMNQKRVLSEGARKE